MGRKLIIDYLVFSILAMLKVKNIANVKNNFYFFVKFVIVITIMGCTPEAQDDIPLFQEYIAENINKKSDDPYVSSTVKPDEPLYEFLYKLQQGRGDLSILEPLIEEGNTDAMVWKARAESDDVNVRGETIALLGRAMKAGNPYAALALSDGGEECWDFGKNSLSSQVANSIGEKLPTDVETCSAENWDRAIEGFQQLAEQGDLPAQYFLLTMKRIQQPDDSRESRDLYIKEIIRFAKGYYYKPMMDYVNKILKSRGNDNQLTGETPELEKLATDLLSIAVNYNYTPAINKLIEYRYTSLEKDSPLFLQGVQLGSKRTLRLLQAFEFDNETLSSEEKYYIEHVYQHISGQSYLYWGVSLPQAKVEEVVNKINSSVEDMTPVVYIDGFTRKIYWGDK